MYKYTRIEDIPPDDVTKIVDGVARYIVERFPGMSSPALFFLEMNRPFAYVYGELGRFYTLPFLSFLTPEEGDNTQKYISVFSEKKNIALLIDKIEELSRKPKENKGEKKETSLLEKIKSLFR